MHSKAFIASGIDEGIGGDSLSGAGIEAHVLASRVSFWVHVQSLV